MFAMLAWNLLFAIPGSWYPWWRNKHVCTVPNGISWEYSETFLFTFFEQHDFLYWSFFKVTVWTCLEFYWKSSLNYFISILVYTCPMSSTKASKKHVETVTRPPATQQLVKAQGIQLQAGGSYKILWPSTLCLRILSLQLSMSIHTKLYIHHVSLPRPERTSENCQW